MTPQQGQQQHMCQRVREPRGALTREQRQPRGVGAALLLAVTCDAAPAWVEGHRLRPPGLQGELYQQSCSKPQLPHSLSQRTRGKEQSLQTSGLLQAGRSLLTLELEGYNQREATPVTLRHAHVLLCFQQVAVPP